MNDGISQSSSLYWNRQCQNPDGFENPSAYFDPSQRGHNVAFAASIPTQLEYIPIQPPTTMRGWYNIIIDPWLQGPSWLHGF